MGNLKINHDKITSEIANKLVSICPFGAISYNGEKFEISSACKMCKLCVKNSDGAILYEEEQKQGIDKSKWKGILVYVNHDKGKIHRVTYELLGKARELSKVTGHQVYALLIGHNVSDLAEKLCYYEVDKVYCYDALEFEEFKIEPYTQAFYDFIRKVKPSSVLVGATNLGRMLAPRIAARCKAGLTADCTVLQMKENTDLVQIRPAFGGNIMAQIVSPNTRPQFCTVRYKVFAEPKPTDVKSGEIINMPCEGLDLSSYIDVISSKEKPKEIDISESEIVVAVGRGASGDTALKYAKELADLLGATLACTRPLAENNVFDVKHQIGLSGRTVKPKFIICLGISGAVQFTAGMKSSDVIVAINTDKNAPIFDVAHYKVVGDVLEILPELIARIKEGKGNA